MIEVSGLTKRYATHTAVDGISFRLEQGQIYGLLGPNGAGKSTTMKMLTGCLFPTEGSILIGGHDIFSEPNAAKQLVGYLPELPPLYPSMTPEEYLFFLAELKGIAAAERKAAVAEVIEKTQLTPMKNRLIRHLSKGYGQRLGIAQALLGTPEVLILDEPTVGLDPAQIIEIRNLLKELGKNHTVILSSHILTEIAAICDRILILSGGKLLANDTPAALRQRVGAADTLFLSIKGEAPTVQRALEGLLPDDAAPLTSDAEGRVAVRLPLTDSTLQPRLLERLQQAALPVLEMGVKEITLEDIFLQLVADTQSSGKGEK